MLRYTLPTVLDRRFILLCLVSCTAELEPGDDVFVECTDNAQCPTGFICADAGRCVGENTACIEAGVSVPNGNRCPLRTDTPGVCIDGACFESRCGDAIVDDRLGESCDCGDRDRDPIDRCDSVELTLNGDTADRCRSDCSPPRCGDGILDSDEVCDDGNLVSGDGCSGDCLSDETCGNGYLDATRAEVCDDGNARSRDGCTGECRVVEVPNWDLESNLLDRGREVTAIAYDSDREVIVIFGGTDGALFGDTLELRADGDAADPEWRLSTVTTESSPPPRRLAQMVYDRNRRRMVLFGGRESFDAVFRNDTWEYDGTRWVQTDDGTGSAPSIRATPALGYERSSGRVVLFGGDVPGADVLGDTWTYDGTGWTRLNPTEAPSPRTQGTFAWSGTALTFFGGTNPDGRPDDTWTFDGSEWTRLEPAERAPGRSRHSMSASADGTGVLVFGGADGPVLNDSWTFDGATWSECCETVAPSPRFFFGMVRFDAVNRVVLFGGTDATGRFFDDVWTHDGIAWSQEEFLPFDPEGRRNHALAFDSRRQRMVLAGGTLGTTLNDSWEYDGNAWSEQASYGGVADGVEATAAVYHEARGVVVLFSGRRGEVSVPTTWEYDGIEWVNPSPDPAPSARFQHAMAYDRRRERVILYGGCAEFQRGATCNPESILSDSWVYDTEWQQLFPASSPPPLFGHTLSYDESRDRVVLFGGDNTAVTSGETWEFDGDAWREIETSGPAPRWAHGAVYDPVSTRVVLFGGFERVAGDFSDTWTYGADGWQEVFPAFVPTARRNFGMAYDRERRGVFLYGGQPRDPGAAYLFRLTSSQPTERCDSSVDADSDGLAGCDDPDCNFSIACTAVEMCSNQLDDDGDGAVDCDDPNCGGSPCDGNGSTCIAGACVAP
ncbi:MAG: DUF4215 domain-containing protein [Myxococcota bacterium]